MGKALALLAAAALLAGCNTLRQDERDILARGWTAPAPAPQPEPKVYCYGTLAEKDCYPSPQPGQDYRRVGSAPEPRP